MSPSGAENPWQTCAEGLGLFLRPAVPFIVHAAAAGSAFTLGLAGTQFAGHWLRVSCATPVLAPALGLVGVGISSALAGQASIYCRAYLRDGRSPLQGRPPEAFRNKDLLLDALAGVTLYKLMGGRFRNMMPSDLFHAGAMARESLPAAGREYARDVPRRELLRMLKRDGCHHCGRRGSAVIADHIPPNKLVFGGTRTQFEKGLNERAKVFTRDLGRGSHSVTRLLRATNKALNIELGPVPQRYFPQCRRCSGRQAIAARAGKRTLVVHYGGIKPWYFAGILASFRHYTSPDSTPPHTLWRHPEEGRQGRGRLRGGWRPPADTSESQMPWWRDTRFMADCSIAAVPWACSHHRPQWLTTTQQLTQWQQQTLQCCPVSAALKFT